MVRVRVIGLGLGLGLGLGFSSLSNSRHPPASAGARNHNPQPSAHQEPKLVSGATQVMQSTITPASAPISNINEKRFGKEPKTVDQARRGVPVPVGHPRRTHATP